MKPQLTLTVRCASRDNFLATQGVPSFFAGLLHCLRQQTFRNFEFVFVDAYYAENREAFAKLKADFVVKHVDMHPGHRYWYDKGWAAMAGATNTAILYADGELIVSLDDAEFFNADLLERYWRAYQDGACLHACHRRLRTFATQDGLPVVPLSGDLYINDSRMARLAKHGTNGVLKHSHGQWLYAGKSFSLADALKLNGFNERCDGNCSLEDCEFGVRLELLGRKFTFDQDGCVFIVDHPTYMHDDTGKKLSREFVAIENYGFVCCVRELFDYVANKPTLTDRHMAIINRETKKFRSFDIYCDENKERLAIWQAMPTFDLVEERAALRNSPEWVW